MAVRGFNAPCPRCGEGAVRVALWDMNNLFCADCEEEFTLEDVRTLVECWGKVLAWLDTAPVAEVE